MLITDTAMSMQWMPKNTLYNLPNLCGHIGAAVPQ